MRTDLFLELVVRPALILLGERYQGAAAERMLVATAFQESDLRWRRQLYNGPGRSFWSFEMSGIKGVLKHPYTRDHAAKALFDFGYAGATAGYVRTVIEHSDVLGCALARLLLWTIPEPLPQEEHEAWRQYLAAWRPGKPRPETWPRSWAAACEACG